ncbi:MAG: ArsB/NhaD family transporter [Actinomycetota bacterium]
MTGEQPPPDAARVFLEPLSQGGDAVPGHSDLRFRVTLVALPLAGIVAMIAFGVLRQDDVTGAAATMWRPVVTIASIMVITAGAGRLGLLKRVAAILFSRAEGSTVRLFTITFALSALTAATLNNDSAILLLTPIVIPLVRQLYPGNQEMLYPFAFAVFMAAGVAPLVVSNPMNLIVADYAGLGFNAYLVRMLPVALAGWVVTILFLRLAFRRTLDSSPASIRLVEPDRAWTGSEISSLLLVLGVLAAYPVASYLGGPLWAVASAGALATFALCAVRCAGSPADIARRDVSWDILVFLTLLAVFAVGAQKAGISDLLADIYDRGGIISVGTISAIGSALINNHPMSLINISALDPTPTSEIKPVLAALIGGDLGPRMLPAGSLAGLLWLATLRRLGVQVSLAMFVRVGLLLTVPSMVVSLLVLSLLG